MTIETEKIKAQMKRRPKREEDKPLLSSGLSLLNLACSGRIKGAFKKGTYNLLVGDSVSGKTMLALTTLAEACLSKDFKDHRLVYDASERGDGMNVGKFWPKLVSRLEKIPPSQTLEDFYDRLEDVMKDSPCVWVEDSMDALVPRKYLAKLSQDKKARAKGKEDSGSYGTDKAKINSDRLRMVVQRLEKTGSILLIISQTRDNIGFDAKFNPKTRSGGKALRFYASNELWFSIKGRIKRTVRDKPRKVGDILKVQIKKNRQTGREPFIHLHFYPNAGFDDVGSMVAWLVEEGHWKATKGVITASEWDKVARAEQLVQWVEQEGLEAELRSIIAGVWAEIEEACSVERKNRYS